jgi:hypothetical protein
LYVFGLSYVAYRAEFRSYLFESICRTRYGASKRNLSTITLFNSPNNLWLYLLALLANVMYLILSRYFSVSFLWVRVGSCAGLGFGLARWQEARDILSNHHGLAPAWPGLATVDHVQSRMSGVALVPTVMYSDSIHGCPSDGISRRLYR